jgi:hypothetical protein
MAIDRPDRSGKKTLVTYVDEDLWRKVRYLAVDRATTTQALGEEAFKDLLEKAAREGAGKRESIGKKETSRSKPAR